MIRILCFLCFLFGVGIMEAQTINDAFLDMNLSSIWQGDRDNFIINSDNQLQLLAPMEGSSLLSASFDPGDSTSWEFFVNLDFNPSNSNSLEIYLAALNPDLISSDAYFIQIGESGSIDPIRLMKRINNVETEIQRSADGIAASSPVFRLRITRNAANLWFFEIDETGGSNYSDLFSITDGDIALTSTVYFGFHCSYTSTRVDKFFFDDIAVGEIVPDTQGPEVLAFEILSATDLVLTFNEAIDPGSLPSALLDWNNTYSGTEQLSVVNNDERSILITLDPPLSSPEQYELRVTGLSDLAENEMIPYTRLFEYIESSVAKPYEILITEIMADPTPTIGLPDAEYIELYNNSSNFFNLEDYAIASGNSIEFLDSYDLAPEEYVLIIDDGDDSKFDFVSNKILVEGLFNLSNAGDDIAVFNNQNEQIHRIDYNLDWYQSSTRADGGYSLEMKTLSNPCLGVTNWAASSSLAGGTPGLTNANNLDTLINDGPQLSSAFALSNDSIVVEFDRALGLQDFATLIEIDNLPISSIQISEEANNRLIIELDTPLEEGTIYTLIVSFGIADCAGFERSINQSTNIAVAVQAEPQDLIITEILSDPYPGESDFIEIYNASDKVIALSGLALRNDDRDETIVLDISRSIFPDNYFVISESRASILQNYTVVQPDWLVEHEIPALNNDQGNIQLGYVNIFGLDLIDEVNYDEDMHYEFLDDTEGITLEKIDLSTSGLERDNWHSASTSSGYGTPTGRNSQAIDSDRENQENLTLASKSFSPDQDGFEDLAILRYDLSKPGYRAKIEIFSDEGRKVKSLVDGFILGTTGTVKWTGLNEDNEMLPIGIYIFAVELIHPDGDVVQELLPVVLSQKF